MGELYQPVVALSRCCATLFFLNFAERNVKSQEDPTELSTPKEQKPRGGNWLQNQEQLRPPAHDAGTNSSWTPHEKGFRSGFHSPTGTTYNS
jgi:hypothetical protein